MAVHETGHTLVAALSTHADPVAKVTILPAGQALGVTEQLPETERHLYPESYLKDSLAVRLGRPGSRTARAGRGLDGGIERPGRCHPAGRAHDPGMGSVGAGRADRLRVGRPRLPGRTGLPPARTPRRRNGPSTRRWPGCSAKHKNGPHRCSRPTDPNSTRSSPCCWKRRPSTAASYSPLAPGVAPVPTDATGAVGA